MLHSDSFKEASMAPSPFEQIYRIVRRIPRGRVATYGQISRMLDGRLSAQFVGWAMHAAPDGVPWHRVINAKGGISTRQVLGYAPDLQKQLLEAEGVEFDENDRCDLTVYQWEAE
jgi:methylated-DNA-protein-cysteine methyltransferase related protein